MYEYDEIAEVSLAAISKLNAAGIKCTVLTKGILPEFPAGASDKNEYGVTLISLDEDFRERVEPGAASYQARLASLRRLHDLGCKTWVSVEPYPTPNIIKQDLGEILEAIAFTDRIIFGRTNYNKEASAYAAHRDFYNEQAQTVIEFCEAHNIQYHIKNGTITELTKVG
jgi:DNA repair photolyase